MTQRREETALPVRDLFSYVTAHRDRHDDRAINVRTTGDNLAVRTDCGRTRLLR